MDYQPINLLVCVGEVAIITTLRSLRLYKLKYLTKAFNYKKQRHSIFRRKESLLSKLRFFMPLRE
jgi:hypothetical protein